jgi:hypothetical protein
MARGQRHGTELEATRRAIAGAKRARREAAKFYAGRLQFGKAVEVLTRPIPQPNASAETLRALETERKAKFIGAIQPKKGAIESWVKNAIGGSTPSTHAPYPGEEKKKGK